MKASVIREMSSTEIRERIETEKSAYHKMKMNHVVSNLENPIKLKFARKAIARLSTELTKRELENVESNSAPVKAEKSKETDPTTEEKETTEAAVEAEEGKEEVESDENEKA